MTAEQIHEKLNNLYDSNSSRNFINHMIRAYFPVDKVEKVWDTPKGKFKCAITNESLFSMADVLVIIRSDDAKNSFIENMRTMISEPNKPIKAFDETLKAKLNNRKMGVTGKDTDTFMSLPAYHEFFNWLTKKILEGDKHINGMIAQMQNKEMLDKIEDALPQAEKEKVRALRNNPPTESKKPIAATFGDLDVLQQLKAKLESEGK